MPLNFALCPYIICVIKGYLTLHKKGHETIHTTQGCPQKENKKNNNRYNTQSDALNADLPFRGSQAECTMRPNAVREKGSAQKREGLTQVAAAIQASSPLGWLCLVQKHSHFVHSELGKPSSAKVYHDPPNSIKSFWGYSISTYFNLALINL